MKCSTAFEVSAGIKNGERTNRMRRMERMIEQWQLTRQRQRQMALGVRRVESVVAHFKKNQSALELDLEWGSVVSAMHLAVAVSSLCLPFAVWQ